MSWDIVLISSTQKIKSIDELDVEQLVEIDFCSVLNSYFIDTIKDGNHFESNAAGSLVDYYVEDELVSNKMVSVYGEKGLFELVYIAKENNWQIFDTSLNAIIDLENPAKNGYESFQRYKSQLLK